MPSRAPVRPRLRSMTIKMDRAGCLTLPRSLVCNHGPPKDVFLVGGCLGCRERKPGKLARVKEFICMGVWACPLETIRQEIQSGLKGAGSLVLWSFSVGLSASCFHSALLLCPLTSLPTLGCCGSSRTVALASELPRAAALDLLWAMDSLGHLAKPIGKTVLGLMF